MLRGVGRLRAGGASFSPASLFASGEAGLWVQAYDPNTIAERRNELTYSDDLTNGVWGKVLGVTAPTATTVDFPQLTSGERVEQTPGKAAIPGDVWTFSLELSGVPGETINVALDANDGTGGSEEQTIVLTAVPTVYSLTHTFTSAASSTALVRAMIVWRSGNTAGSVSAEAMQLNRGAERGDYQAVTDWDTEYLALAGDSVCMWQDTTTPVTAVEQPVGLWMDLHQGVTRGANIFDPLDFTTAGTIGDVTSVSAASFTTGATGGGPAFAAAATVGKVYELHIAGTTSASQLQIRNTNGLTGSVTLTGDFDVRAMIPWAENGTVWFYNTDGGTTSIVSISMVEVAGHHASQTVGVSRPVLSARINLQPNSLMATNWVAAGTTPPTVTNNASLLGEACVAVEFQGASDSGYAGSRAINFTDTYAFSADETYRQSFNISLSRALVGAEEIAVFTTGAQGFEPVLLNAGNSAQYVGAFVRTYADELTVNTSGSNSPAMYLNSALTAGPVTVYVNKVDIRTLDDAALSQPPYQRVSASNDYETEGFSHYLKLDGTDDSLQTDSVDFSSADKLGIWVGHTKQSEAAAAMLLELTANGGTTAGGAYITAPNNAASGNYGFSTFGTGSPNARFATTYAPPVSAVASAQMDNAAATAADQNAPRINAATPSGLTAGSLTSAGNFANAAVNIGRRNNASLPFTGRVYAVVMRGAQTSPFAVYATERYVGLRMGLDL